MYTDYLQATESLNQMLTIKIFELKETLQSKYGITIKASVIASLEWYDSIFNVGRKMQSIKYIQDNDISHTSSFCRSRETLNPVIN